jgi:hypothetical protein
MHQTLFTLNISGGGTKKEILQALRDISHKLENGNQEIDYSKGEIQAEISEVCPYHEMDENYNN